MHPARNDAGPLLPATRWRRLVQAVRAILRPRATSLSWGAGRVLAGAILAAGVTARALFGWRWWVVVIVLTLAGEAALVASTLARSADREELIDELVAALWPRRQVERRTRRALERFRAAPFPVYGLPPSWTGERFLGGWATRRERRSGAERTTGMQLGHGDRLTDRGPLLLVEVDAGAGLDWGAGEGGAGAAGAARAGLGAAAGEGGGGAGVERVEVAVDGEPVTFEVVGDGRHWVAQSEHGDMVVTLEARDLPLAQVRLVRITDLEPYLAAPPVR